jgi:polysaccharide export outer membrane protein
VNKGELTGRPLALSLARLALAAELIATCSSCATRPADNDSLFGAIRHSARAPQPADAKKHSEPVPAPALSEPSTETPRTTSPAPERAAVKEVAAGPSATPTPMPEQERTSEEDMPEPGLPSYRISPGDVIAASYFARTTRDIVEYFVDAYDVLTISVVGQTPYSDDVTVRPDGYISFYLVGEMRVRGKTVPQIRAELADRMSAIMPAAEVTVILKSGNGASREFLNTIRSNTDMGSTRLMRVRRDGMVSFPLIGDITAVGRTPAELSREVEARYGRVLRGGIAVTLNVESSSESNIAILGEVRQPGRYGIVNPVSPFFALAMAGGALESAKKSQIVVVKRRPGGKVAWHVVNLDLNSGAPLGPEIPLESQDMLLVPRNGIASLNLFVEQWIRRMMPLPGGFGLSYDLNP